MRLLLELVCVGYFVAVLYCVWKAGLAGVFVALRDLLARGDVGRSRHAECLRAIARLERELGIVPDAEQPRIPFTAQLQQFYGGPTLASRPMTIEHYEPVHADAVHPVAWVER